MTRKAYIYPADSYLGRSLGAACKAQGFEVLGGHASAEAPDFLSASYQIGSHAEHAVQRQFLAVADVVIYEMHGHERAARDAVVHMAKQPFGGRMQLFVGVSTPLVWAATRPAPPGEEEVDVDVPDSASDLLEQQAGGGAAATTDPAGAATAPATPRTDASHPPALQQSASGRARADPYAAAAAAGALTDRDAWRRAPCLRVREVHELEQLVVRSQRKGKLRTAVVCPGFLYGRGEADGGLHPLMRQAWELGPPLKIYGTGTNVLPMMHVDDCAAYLVALAGPASAPAAPGGAPALMAGLPDVQQYLLAVDAGAAPGQPGGVQQGELVAAIAERLGNGGTTTVPSEELLFLPDVEQWTLNTPMACTPLPAAAGFSPRYSAGVMPHLDEVLQQWRDARGVNPLRVVLAGAPMAGKSLVASRLAELYQLPLYNAKQLLASADKLGPDDAKALAAEMSGKEPRASAKSLAALLRAVVAGDKRAVNRGYVLDGLPKTAGAARWAFMKLAPLTPEELAEKQKEEAAGRAQSPSKGAKGGAAPPAKPKDAKGGAKGGAGDGPDVPEGHKLVADPALAPTHLVELEAAAEELAGRRAAVEALELEALRAATPPAEAGKPAAKGGRDKAPASASHNNEKDYQRRQATWAQIKAEEQADLEAQAAAAKATWERQQEERETERLRAEAEARTLRARRRRMREQAAAAAGGDGPTAAAAATAGPALPAAGGAGEAAGEASTQEQETEGGAAPAPAAEEPALPKFGGLPGVVVAGCAAQYLQLPNADQAGGPPATQASWERGNEEDEEAPARLEALERRLCDFLGPARNFEGLHVDHSPLADEAADGNLLPSPSGSRSHRSRPPPPQPAIDSALAQLLREQAQAAEAQAKRSVDSKFAATTEPIRSYIMAHVMPTVTEALRTLAVERPQDPLRFLGEHLIKEAIAREAQWTDPYAAPAYEQQRQKLVDKQARDEARALAEAQKAEKELTAKQASKLAALQEAEAAAAVAPSGVTSPRPEVPVGAA